MAIVTLTSGENGANSLADINANFADLDTTKADLASPTFTGTVTLPTGLTGILQATAGVVSVNSSVPIITVETTTGTTHSLTTVANQKVIVWAKGTITDLGAPTDRTITLKYNTVTKDTTVAGINSTNPSVDNVPFALMYTETPGAATQNITVETSGGTLSNVVIIVMKIS